MLIFYLMAVQTSVGIGGHLKIITWTEIDRKTLFYLFWNVSKSFECYIQLHVFTQPRHNEQGVTEG